MAQKSKPSLKTWNFSGSRLILNVRILARRGRLTSHPGRTATAAVRNAFPMSLCWNRLRKALPFPLLPSLQTKTCTEFTKWLFKEFGAAELRSFLVYNSSMRQLSSFPPRQRCCAGPRGWRVLPSVTSLGPVFAGRSTIRHFSSSTPSRHRHSRTVLPTLLLWVKPF